MTFARVDGGLEAALGTMTRVRRLLRRPHPDMEALPVIFNDYMNCLWGNPTTEALIPIIDKAAEIGRGVFRDRRRMVRGNRRDMVGVRGCVAAFRDAVSRSASRMSSSAFARSK